MLRDERWVCTPGNIQTYLGLFTLNCAPILTPLADSLIVAPLSQAMAGAPMLCSHPLSTRLLAIAHWTVYTVLSHRQCMFVQPYALRHSPRQSYNACVPGYFLMHVLYHFDLAPVAARSISDPGF